MAASLEVYAFVDKKQDGYFPVLDTDGALLARIDVPMMSRRFSVTTADGRALCSGRPRGFGGSSYEVVDGAGALLLTVRTGFWSGKRRTVMLANGTELSLQGETWPSRDWNVTDAAGRTVLSIVATASGWSFHPDAYGVQVGDPALTLAHVVGIVEANRMLVKSARSSAGGV